MTLKIVLEPSDEGGYTAYAPSLPGCVSEGDTLDEALANIREAIELYLDGGEEETDRRWSVSEAVTFGWKSRCQAKR